MTEPDRQRLAAFVDGSVRRELTRTDGPAATWDFDRVFRVAAATVSVLVGLLGAYAADRKDDSSNRAKSIQSEARKVADQAQRETAVSPPPPDGDPAPWPDVTAWRQWILAQELADRLGKMDPGSVPHSTMVKLVAVFSGLSPDPAPPLVYPLDPPSDPTPPSAPSVAINNLPADSNPPPPTACCCCRPSTPMVLPIIVTPPPAPPPQEEKPAPDDREPAFDLKKALQRIDRLGNAAAVVTYRVPWNGYSECRTVLDPDLDTEPLIVQFRVTEEQKQVSVQAVNCNPDDGRQFPVAHRFQGHETQVFRIQPGDHTPSLNVNVIAVETESRLAGLGRRKTAAVISVWITHPRN